MHLYNFEFAFITSFYFLPREGFLIEELLDQKFIDRNIAFETIKKRNWDVIYLTLTGTRKW